MNLKIPNISVLMILLAIFTFVDMRAMKPSSVTNLQVDVSECLEQGEKALAAGDYMTALTMMLTYLDKAPQPFLR